jgi:hypothetical protein
MIIMTCPKCGTWVMASEVTAAGGYLRCGVCALVYPVPVLKSIWGASKLGRFAKWAVAGVTLIGILVSLSKLWPEDNSPWEQIEQALSPSAAPLAPEAATIAPESAVGGWRSAQGAGDAGLFGTGDEWGALMARQRIWQQGGEQQLEGREDR